MNYDRHPLKYVISFWGGGDLDTSFSKSILFISKSLLSCHHHEPQIKLAFNSVSRFTFYLTTSAVLFFRLITKVLTQSYDSVYDVVNKEEQ